MFLLLIESSILRQLIHICLLNDRFKTQDAEKISAETTEVKKMMTKNEITEVVVDEFCAKQFKKFKDLPAIKPQLRDVKQGCQLCNNYANFKLQKNIEQ